jgi:hypothetical protein
MTVKATKEEIEMNMPGFTAEASLYDVSTRYRATAEASFYGGPVQPAGSEVFFPNPSILSSCWRYVWQFVDTSPGAPFPPNLVWFYGLKWVC